MFFSQLQRSCSTAVTLTATKQNTKQKKIERTKVTGQETRTATDSAKHIIEAYIFLIDASSLPTDFPVEQRKISIFFKQPLQSRGRRLAKTTIFALNLIDWTIEVKQKKWSNLFMVFNIRFWHWIFFRFFPRLISLSLCLAHTLSQMIWAYDISRRLLAITPPAFNWIINGRFVCFAFSKRRSVRECARLRCVNA